MGSIPSDISTQRMSFVFPEPFYRMLQAMSEKHDKDMTYIVMEAVNEWVLSNEGIDESLLPRGISIPMEKRR
jgi:hypothetical protein